MGKDVERDTPLGLTLLRSIGIVEFSLIVTHCAEILERYRRRLLQNIEIRLPALPPCLLFLESITGTPELFRTRPPPQ